MILTRAIGTECCPIGSIYVVDTNQLVVVAIGEVESVLRIKGTVFCPVQKIRALWIVGCPSITVHIIYANDAVILIVGEINSALRIGCTVLYLVARLID